MKVKIKNNIYYSLMIFVMFCFAGLAGAVFVTYLQKNILQANFVTIARTKTLALVSQVNLHQPQIKLLSTHILEVVFSTFSDNDHTTNINSYIIDTTFPTTIVYDLNKGKIIATRYG